MYTSGFFVYSFTNSAFAPKMLTLLKASKKSLNLRAPKFKSFLDNFKVNVSNSLSKLHFSVGSSGA